MDMQEALREYLAPVEANNSLTIEHKKVIADYVRGFADFIDAKQHAIDNPEKPVEDVHVVNTEPADEYTLKDVYKPEKKQTPDAPRP